MNSIREHVILELRKKIDNFNTTINIEKSIFNFCIKNCDKKYIEKSWDNPVFEYMYKQKFILINITLNDEHIIEKLNSKEILARNLSFMTPEELCPEKWKAIEFVDDNVEDGIFQCRKCKSRKTTYYSMQTRSADEPMTNFITCIECGNRWKM